MDGVLVIDKPPGLTSHDVVAAVRRAVNERRIGHTGTLDPLATGVLPLACGRATRLVRFLTGSGKDYDAAVVFGMTTDTCDVTGSETSRTDRRPSREAVEHAIASLTGSYLQTPPAHSAKKVGGQRAYELARRNETVELTPVPVTVSRARVSAFDGNTVHVSLPCSAGFYVRAFARSLGDLVGTGACLASLRRTRSGQFTLAQALPLDGVLQTPAAAVEGAVPLDELLDSYPSRRLTADERVRVAHGQQLRSGADTPLGGSESSAGWVRLLDSEGHLVALATPGKDAGSLHPAVVLI